MALWREGQAAQLKPRVRRLRAECCAYSADWGVEAFLGELRPRTVCHHRLGQGIGKGKMG